MSADSAFGALRRRLSSLPPLCRISLCGVSYWYSYVMVKLSDDEARGPVKTILEAIEAADEGTQVRASWSLEATDWCYLILDRLAEGEQ